MVTTDEFDKQLVNFYFPTFIDPRNTVQLYWPFNVPNRSQFWFIHLVALP